MALGMPAIAKYLSDILWRHADGTVAIWHDAKPDWTDWPGVLDHYWQIQGVGDFDGDGKSDILWRHATVGWRTGPPAARLQRLDRHPGSPVADSGRRRLRRRWEKRHPVASRRWLGGVLAGRLAR